MNDAELEAIVADVLEDYDRVNFGRWRLRVNEQTTVSPISTREVAQAVLRRIQEELDRFSED